VTLVRTLATGLTGAIGCDYIPARNLLVFVDFNAGKIMTVDLTSGNVMTIGTGYGFPEDIVIGPDGDGAAYVTERVGTLVRVDLSNANRSAATVLHSGMVAPQQIALSADGKRAYTVEYTSSGGQLWRVDLGVSPSAQAVVSNLNEAVGLLISEDESFALISEQANTGTVSRFTIGTGDRQQLVGNVPAPFFMRWADARRTSFFLPLRDPQNRIVKVSLAPRQPTVTDVFQTVPFRPSSNVVTTSHARVIICSDAEVGEYQLPTGSGMKILGIVYDPPGPDIKAERIILQNQGSEAADLSGWTMRDAANHVYTFKSGTYAQPSDVLRLWTKSGQDGGGDLYWNRGAAVWNNTPGDVAKLRNAQGTDVDTYPYSTPSASVAPGAAQPVGPGGGGAMYSPVVSPHDPNLLYVACDMGGLYRSQNGGAEWTMIDGHQMMVSINIDRGNPPRVPPPKLVVCHPDQAKQDWLLAWGEFRGLRLSKDKGATWTEIPIGKSGMQSWASTTVTALGIDPDNGRLFVGTIDGAHYHDPDATGSWSGQSWNTCSVVAGHVISFVLRRATRYFGRKAADQRFRRRDEPGAPSQPSSVRDAADRLRDEPGRHVPLGGRRR
jgi:hypothetical protein